MSFSVQKVSREEQVVLILSERTHELVSRLPNANEAINHLRFRDFIEVTPDDVLAYVEKNGFPQSNVAEEGGRHHFHGDNQFRICRGPMGWELFFTERGIDSVHEIFSTLADARSALVAKLFELAKICLNHRYWHAHPELNLPSPSSFE